MTDFNLQEVVKWLIIGLLLVCGISLIVNPAHAEIVRIPQGGEVFVNDTYDIAGTTGWAPFLAYYGSYEDRIAPDNGSLVFKIPLPSYKLQTTYYIDPVIFSGRPGNWYQYYADGGDERGNMLAFRVVNRYYTLTNLTGNDTYNMSIVYNPANVTPLINPPKPILSEINVSDYLVARGDSLVIGSSGSRSWLFGRVDGIYGRESSGNATVFTARELSLFEPGSYTLLIQKPGRNTIYDASYSGGALVPGLYGKDPVDIAGLQPRLVQERLIAMLTDTDDEYSLFRVEVEDPTISIVSIDEVYHVNATVLDVRGYTNVANGTRLSFVVDEKDQTARMLEKATVYAVAQGTVPGNLRYYQAFIPIDFDGIAPGQHSITGRTPLGSVVTAPWYVYSLPEGQMRPNGTIKYVSGRYGPEEFVPTPTPIIERVVETQTVVVVETVVVPVTPSDEQVRGEQQAVIVDLFWQTVWWVAGIVAVVAAAGYVLFVRARVREGWR